MKNAAAPPPPEAHQPPKQASPGPNQRPASPKRPASPNQATSPKRSSPGPPAQEEEEEFESAEDLEGEEENQEDDVEEMAVEDADENIIDQDKVLSASNSTTKAKSLKIVKKKRQNEEPREDTPTIAFEEGDFPALGKISIQSPSVSVDLKTKEPVIRMARGNQKQRREEKLKMERMGAASMDDHDSDLSIPRHVCLFVPYSRLICYIGTIQWVDEKA